MRRDEQIQIRAALADCGRASIDATNGHTRRWARTRCAGQLHALGTSPAIAQHCAEAMDVIGRSVQAVLKEGVGHA